MRGAPASVARPRGTTGAPPPVVLVHGVGFGPETLAPLARALHRHTPTIVMTRRGYASRHQLTPAVSVDEHVRDLVAELDRLEVERAVLAGMSGGATIVLAATLTHPERVTVAVAHEPAVGSVSPELRRLVADALAHGGGSLARVLAGERTWQALPAPLITALDESAPLIEQDARAFLAFEPLLPPPGTGVALVCSVGDRSHPLRREVAARLSARTGAPVVLIADCGHLPQFDAPAAFAQLILDHARTGENQRSLPCP